MKYALDLDGVIASTFEGERIYGIHGGGTDDDRHSSGNFYYR